MKRAHEKFSSISKLGFSVLVACLIAVPALMGTVFVNAFNGNLVAFAADLEASPQSLSEAKAALDAAKQNQEAASAQHDEAKNAYDSSTADYNAAVSEHAVAQKASDEAKAKGKSEFNAAKANAAAKVDAAQKKLDQANTEKQDLLNELKAQEQVVAAAQAAYDAAAANAPGVEEASANLKRGQEDKAASEAALAQAKKAADEAHEIALAANETRKKTARLFDEAVNAYNESVRVYNKAARAYEKAWEALHNSADGDPTGALQEAVEDAWKKYEQAEQAMDAKKQEEDAAEKAYGDAQTNAHNKNNDYLSKLSEFEAYQNKGMTDEELERLSPVYAELTLAREEGPNVEVALSTLETRKSELKTALEAKEAKQKAYDAAVHKVETAQTELDAAGEALAALSEVYDSSSNILIRAQGKCDTAQTALDGAKEAEKTALSELGNAKSAYDTALGNYRTAENNLNEAAGYWAICIENCMSMVPRDYYTQAETLRQAFDSLHDHIELNSDLSININKIITANKAREDIYTSEENQNARAAIADAQAKLDNKDILVQRRDDLQTVSTTAKTASDNALTEKNTASTNNDKAVKDAAEKQSSYDQLSAKALQAQSDLNAAESALVSLQEAYDRALSLQGSSTNEMSDARNALDAAKAKQESLNARFNALMATVSNAESELKQAKEESNGVQALSWESALRSPVLMPAYAYLNSFVEAYRALQNPLRAAEDRMNAAYETMNSNKRIFDTAVGNLSDANEAVKTAQANYDQALVSASSNQAPVKKSTPSANTDPLPLIVGGVVVALAVAALAALAFHRRRVGVKK